MYVYSIDTRALNVKLKLLDLKCVGNLNDLGQTKESFNTNDRFARLFTDNECLISLFEVYRRSLSS